MARRKFLVWKVICRHDDDGREYEYGYSVGKPVDGKTVADESKRIIKEHNIGMQFVRISPAPGWRVGIG